MSPPPPLRVVVAPDKFRGSLTATAAAGAAAAGARDAAGRLGIVLDLQVRPVADGGEGVVDAALAAGYAARSRAVSGPLGDAVEATFAVGADPGDETPTAVVELATASGLGLLPGGHGDTGTARRATTRGTGELVAAALDEGVRRVVLGIGGSASTDGGTGLAAALGVRFLDARGQDLPPGGAALGDLDRVDVSGLDPRLRDVEVLVACDVDSPLTGESGAATVYGPQKGAGPADVAALDAGLRRLAEVLRDLGHDVSDLPGAGAAGGVGGGAVALLGARLVPGIDLVLDLVGFPSALEGARLVVTGEGSLDAQSLAGKAPVGVARAAAGQGVPVLFLAGRVDLDQAGLAALSRLGAVGVHALTSLEPDLAAAQQHAADLLRTLAAGALEPLLADLSRVPPDPRPPTETLARSTP